MIVYELDTGPQYSKNFFLKYRGDNPISWNCQFFSPKFVEICTFLVILEHYMGLRNDQKYNILIISKL